MDRKNFNQQLKSKTASFDLKTKLILLLGMMLVSFLFVSNVNAQHFTPAFPGSPDYLVVLDDIQLDGGTIITGEVGVFDGILCVGSATITGTYPLQVFTQTASPPLEGYQVGNEMTFKIWTGSEELLSRPVLTQGDGTFGSGGLSRGSIYSYSTDQPYIETISTFDFGTVYSGLPQTYELLITNNWPGLLSVTSVVSNNIPEFTSNASFPLPIAEGSTDTVIITFDPQATGARTAELTVNSNDPLTPGLVVTFNGTGETPLPEITLTPESDLGDQAHFIGSTLISTPISYTMYVRNDGQADLNIISILSDNTTEFSIGAYTTPITPGDSSSVVITFNPQSSGNRSAQVTVNSNDADESAIVLDFSGDATAALFPEIDVLTASIDFGDQAVSTTSSEINLQIRNIGTSNLSISSITSNLPTVFVVGAYSGTVTPSSTINVPITFSPAAHGAANSTITINSDDADEASLNVNVSGNGSNYYNPVESTGLPYTIIIQNATLDGSELLEGDEIGVFDGTTCVGSLIVPADQFTQSQSITVWQANPGQGLPGFTPGNSISFNVLALAAPPEREASATYSAGDGTFGYVPFTQAQVFTFTTFEPVINLPELSHDYGQVIQGTGTTWQMPVQNIGTDDLNVTGISSDDARFSVPAAGIFPVTITPNSIQNFDITFTPDQGGAISGTITIDNNDQQETVGVQGEGLATQPDIDTHPTDVNFGGIAVDVTSQRNVLVTNVGSANLFVSAEIVGDNEFTVSAYQNRTIVPGDTDTLVVSFTPGAVASFSANLNFTSNDPDESVLSVPLVGDGTARHFADPVDTGLPYTIIISGAVLDGDTLVAGDEIAVFDGATIAGSGVVDGNWPYVMTAFQASAAQGLPGFTPGNPMIFRMWELSQDVEVQADTDVEQGNGNFGYAPYSRLSLEALSAQNISVNLSSIDFGNVGVSFDDSVEVVISNVGIGNLLVSSAAITGDSEFTIDPDPYENFTVSASSSDTFKVFFAPNDQGVFSATLTINSDDPDEASLVIPVSGTGLAGTPPALTVNNPVSSEVLEDDESYTINWHIASSTPLRYIILDYSIDGGNNWTRIDSLDQPSFGAGNYIWTTHEGYFTHSRLRITVENIQFLQDSKTVNIIISPQDMDYIPSAGWNLFSLPLSNPETEFETLFEDSLSGTSFLYIYSNSEGYEAVTEVDHGTGYWLAISTADHLRLQGTPEVDTVNIQLENHWNLLQTKIPATLHKNDLKVSNGTDTLQFVDAIGTSIEGSVFAYNNGSGSYELADSIRPWQAYWFLALENNLELIYWQDISGSDEISEELETDSTFDINNWNIEMISRDETGKSQVLTFGVDEFATNLFDYGIDTPAPPISPIASFEIYSTMSNDQPVLTKIMHNYVSPVAPSETYAWEIQLMSQEEQSIEFSFKNLSNLNEIGYYAFLKYENIVYPADELNILDMEISNIVQLIVTSDLNSIKDMNTQLLPKDFDIIRTWPNPFNPSVNVRIAVPERSNIELAIYNILGQEVAVLNQKQLKAGYHNFSWNAFDEASGIYFLQAKNEMDEIRISKLLLIK